MRSQPRWVDTHCHLNRYDDSKAVLAETEAACVYTVAVSMTPSEYPALERMTEGLSFVRPAIGLHPTLAQERRGELSMLWRGLAHNRYVGEVGLDYGTEDPSIRRAQRKVFAQILEYCATSGDKVLSVHSRRATTDVISTIGPGYPGRVILHWFSGSFSDLERAVRFGFYFSVNPAMIRAKRGRALIERIPRNRILTETDGPYVKVSGRAARPADVSLVVAALGRLWGVEEDDAQRVVLNNFRELLIGAKT
jgi:TatD DNase family protein